MRSETAGSRTECPELVEELAAPVCELEPPQAAKYAAPSATADSFKKLEHALLSMLPQKRNNLSCLRSV